MMVEPLSTDHLLSPALTTVKQLSLGAFPGGAETVLGKLPGSLALGAAAAAGSRFILPSAENVILNLTLDVVAAVNGWPLKNVA